jgi:hypothetical protein
VRGWVSVEGSVDPGPGVLSTPFGQAQSNVQGHCHVATASSSCTKAQDAYDKLNCIVLCNAVKDLLVEVLVYSHPWDEFHVNNSR